MHTYVHTRTLQWVSWEAGMSKALDVLSLPVLPGLCHGLVQRLDSRLRILAGAGFCRGFGTQGTPMIVKPMKGLQQLSTAVP